MATKSARAEAPTLNSDKLIATFDDNGLADIKDVALGKSIGFKGDTFSIEYHEHAFGIGFGGNG